jgi:DNA-binding beta-propeller fold protein YncE
MSSIFAGKNDEIGNRDGVGMNAQFNLAFGIAVDQQTGNLFVSDYNNHNIRKITPQGKSYCFSSPLGHD